MNRVDKRSSTPQPKANDTEFMLNEEIPETREFEFDIDDAQDISKVKTFSKGNTFRERHSIGCVQPRKMSTVFETSYKNHQPIASNQNPSVDISISKKNLLYGVVAVIFLTMTGAASIFMNNMKTDIEKLQNTNLNVVSMLDKMSKKEYDLQKQITATEVLLSSKIDKVDYNLLNFQTEMQNMAVENFEKVDKVSSKLFEDLEIIVSKLENIQERIESVLKNDIEFAKRIGQFDTVNKEILGTSEKILEDIDSIQAIYAHSFDDAHFYQAQANLVGDLGHLANERNKQRQELEIEKTKSNIGRNRNFLDKFKFGHL